MTTFVSEIAFEEAFEYEMSRNFTIFPLSHKNQGYTLDVETCKLEPTSDEMKSEMSTFQR